jgi:hypothetical protein
MRTLSLFNLAVFATGYKRVDPVIPGCPCLQNNSCLPDSNCRIALARTKRESNIPLNFRDKRLLRDYGIGECTQCQSAPNPVEEPAETVYVYRQQPIVQAVPEFAVPRTKPAIVIPKTVNVPVQYTPRRDISNQAVAEYVFEQPAGEAIPRTVNMPSQYTMKQPRVEVINQPVFKTVTVPLQPTACQRRKLRAAANQAAKTLENEPCPHCMNCNQQNIPQGVVIQQNDVQPILYRRTTTTESDAAPVPLITIPPTKAE